MTRSESPDEVLVMAAILGDLEAFEELVLRYRPAVVRLAPGGTPRPGGTPPKSLAWQGEHICARYWPLRTVTPGCGTYGRVRWSMAPV